MGEAEVKSGVFQIGLSVRLCRNGERKMQIRRDRAKDMDQKKLGSDALTAALCRTAGGKHFQPIGGQGQPVSTVRNGIDIGIEYDKHALPSSPGHDTPDRKK